MIGVCDGLQDLIARATDGLKRTAAARARVAGVAPGRVNIIGEHVDYAGGVVVPFAIDRWCVAAACGSASGWRVVALDIDQQWTAPAGVDLRSVVVPQGAPRESWQVERGSWESYVVGTLVLASEALAARGARGVGLAPMSIAITSSVPRGSGLSSSAALVVAVAKAVEGLAGVGLCSDGLEFARMCRHAENDFAGVPCGLMDHGASVLGQRGRAVVLTCREPERASHVALPAGLAWLVVESGVARALAAGKYEHLRDASDEAAREMDTDWLWDAGESELEAFAQKLSVPARRAATHTLGERGRVARALAACQCGDIESLKREMNAAHASLRDVLKVSTPELDAIVASAQRLGAGARLVGAGFGGCALVAVESNRADEVGARIRGEFEGPFGRACPVWRVTPSDGARVVGLA